MIKKITLSFFVLFLSLSKAQILDEYPEKQFFYKGGIVSFYKEIHEFLVKNNVPECDENQIYQPRIIVTKDAAIKIVQDGDEESKIKNKCAFDMSMMILKNLDQWTPAEVKGQKIGAITEFILYPKDVQSNYKEGYNPYKYVLSAQYADGNDKFDKDFHNNFMALFEDYHINGAVNLEFYVNQYGKIVNSRFYPSIMNESFNKDFMRSLGRLKKEWKPALYKNIPIKQRIAFPVSFSIQFIER